MRNESIGSFIRKFAAKLLQKGFLSRNPPYTRDLSLFAPTRTLNLLFETNNKNCTKHEKSSKTFLINTYKKTDNIKHQI